MIIRATKLGRTFNAAQTGGTTTVVFQDVTLSVGSEEIVTVFGPNGCGKSTLLKILGGIDKSHSGMLAFEPDDRKGIRYGYVPQSFGESLLPWLNGRENIGFPLRLRGEDGVMRTRHVEEVIREMGLEHKDLPLTERSYKLSGGQQQIVCILRALIADPHVLLLDEPFSALDFETRLTTNERFHAFWSRHKRPTVLVSHDLDEAMLLGTRLLLMGPKPTGILRVFDLPFPKVRSRELVKTHRFNQLRARIVASFLKTVDHD